MIDTGFSMYAEPAEFTTLAGDGIGVGVGLGDDGERVMLGIHAPDRPEMGVHPMARVSWLTPELARKLAGELLACADLLNSATA